MRSVSRADPGFYNFLALGRNALDAPDFLGGLCGALMSADPRSGAQTFCIELFPGWRSRTDGKLASLELFVLRGDLSFNGQVIGASAYVHVAQGCGGGEFSTTGGALVLAFWNPDMPCFPYPYTRNRVIEPWREQWINSVPGSHGVMHKSLRQPDSVPHPTDEGFDGGPGGYLRFQYIEPNTIAPKEHVHHECFEEIILLQGDCFLVNEGQMGIGSVVNHPQEWYHAPFISRTGALLLVHTDAPMGYPWPPRDYPGVDALARAYFEGAEWDRPTAHIPWNQHPVAKLQDASPDYHEWRKSGDSALWGDADPGDRVPFMPAGRGTVSKFRSSWKRCCDE